MADLSSMDALGQNAAKNGKPLGHVGDLVGSDSCDTSQDSNLGSGTQTVVYSCPVDHLGLCVYVKGWLSEHPVHPPILIVHDFAESIASYKPLALELNQRGFNVYVYDLRGHGRSGRILSQINRLSELVNDLLQVTAWVRHKESGQRPLLMGKGFGAQIVSRFALSYPSMVDRLLFVAPAFALKVQPSRWRKIAARILFEISPSIMLKMGWLSWLGVPESMPNPQRKSSGIATLDQFSISTNFLHEMIHLFDMRSIQAIKQFHALHLLPGNSQLFDFQSLLKSLNDFENHQVVSLPEGVEAQAEIIQQVEGWMGDDALSASA